MKHPLLRGALVAIGLAACLVMTLIVFRLPVGSSLSLLVQGAAGDKFAISRTAVKFCPLLFMSVGICISWRAGMYNIGGEGQYLIGGLTGAAVAKFVLTGSPATGPALTCAILVSSVIGGAIYGFIAGLLATRRGVDVVISTILLNFVALQIVGWAVSHPLQEASRSLPQTELLPDAVMIPRWDRQTDTHYGILLALAVATLVYVYLFRTKAGFKLRVVGANPFAARANKILPDRQRELAMVLSGGICGLAGGVEFTATAGQISTSFSQNWGFLAIPVAILGGLHPLIAILSALYFAALFAGSEQLARFTPAGTTLIYVIQATAVLGYLLLAAWSERNSEVQVD